MPHCTIMQKKKKRQMKRNGRRFQVPPCPSSDFPFQFHYLTIWVEVFQNAERRSEHRGTTKQWPLCQGGTIGWSWRFYRVCSLCVTHFANDHREMAPMRNTDRAQLPLDDVEHVGQKLRVSVCVCRNPVAKVDAVRPLSRSCPAGMAANEMQTAAR